MRSMLQRRNFWIILTTLVVIVLGYLLYLNIYIRQNEDRLIESRFRALDQVSLNLNNKIEGYRKNAANFMKKVEMDFNDSLSCVKPNQFKRTVNEMIQSDRILDTLSYRSYEYDMYYDTWLTRSFQTDQLVNNIIAHQKLANTNKNIEFVDLIWDDDLFISERDSLKRSSGKLESSPDYKFLSNIRFTIKVIDRSGYVTFRASNASLFDDILKSHLFDGFIIIENSNLTYSTFSSGVSFSVMENDDDKDPVLEEATDQNMITLRGGGKITRGLLSSGDLQEVTLSNIPYKLFLKPIKMGDETWYVGGLLKSGTFNTLRQRIAPRFILLLSLLLILIILSLPVVKLWVLSRREQLSTATIINSAVSVILGGSFFILFILFVAQNQSRSHNNDENLKCLNRDIYDSLTTELTKIRAQLMAYDANQASIHTFFAGSDQGDKYSLWRVLQVPDTNVACPSVYPHFDYIFWMDGKGMQTYQITTFDTADYLISVASRDYFRNRDRWTFPGTEDARFRIESIVSLTSGVTKAAFSMPSASQYPAIAMTGKLHSLINPILPMDYSFCLVDQSGKTWFHSDPSRNLRENFLRECDDDASLTAAIYGKATTFIDVNYNDQPYRIHIRPVANLPLHLITMYKIEAEQSFQAQVFTLTLILTAALILFIFIQSLFLVMLERIHIRKVNRNLLLEMTRPRKKNNARYVALSRLYFILLVVFSGYMVLINGFTAVLAIFTFVSLTYLHSYRFLNTREARPKSRRAFLVVNLLLIVLFNISIVIVSGWDEFGITAGFQGLLLITLIIFEWQKSYFSKVKTEKYTRNYVIFLIGLLLIFGVIPTLKFYEIAYDKETEIRARHSLYELMKSKETRNRALNAEMKLKPGDSTFHYHDTVITMRKGLGIYTSFQDRTTYYQDDHHHEGDTLKLTIWDKFVTLVRPLYDPSIMQNKFLLGTHAEDFNLAWIGHDSEIHLHYSSPTEDPAKRELSRYGVKTDIAYLTYLFPFMAKSYGPAEKIIYNLLFWVFILLVLYLAYQLVMFGTKRIYGLYIVDMYAHFHFRNVISQRLETDKRIFIARLSPLDETEHIKASFANADDSNYFDWSNEGEIDVTAEMAQVLLEDQQTCMIIDNFDWNYSRPRLFLKKLNELDFIIENRKINMVIISQVHPEKMLEFYATKKTTEDQKEVMVQEGNPGIYNLLAQITSKMIIRYAPVRYDYSWIDENRWCEDDDENKKNEAFIKYELRGSDYLQHYEPAIIEYKESQGKELKQAEQEDRIMVRINALANQYYEDLLDSCTPGEKYVLYDFASDLIMNPKNVSAIYDLLEKGILVKRCDRITFMNESFRKYLLENLDSHSIQELTAGIEGGSGSWQGYRTTLLLVIIGLFVFIALGNREFLNNLNQLFVVLGAGMAFITGVFGLISRRSKSKE